MSDDATKLAVLREAVERADILAATQAKLIETQDALVQSLQRKNRELESRVSELECAIGEFAG